VGFENDALLEMKESFEKRHLDQIVLSESIIPSEMDHRSLAVRIKRSQPDAVLMLLLPPNHGLLANELRKIGYAQAIFGIAPLQNSSELAVAAQALEGAWFVAADDRAAKPVIKEIEAGGSFFVQPDGLLAYEAARLLIDTLLKHGNTSGFVPGMAISGIYGSYQLSENRSFNIPVIVKTVTDKQFVPINTASNPTP
jgi:ABC-type branched-subunit amino acid transport system substrate-binding protein